MIHHIERHIEKMREKPEHVRKQYALSVSFGITAIIFVVWLSTFGARNAALAGNEGSKVNPPLKAIATGMTASAGDAFTYVKEMIFGANKTQYDASDNVEVTGKR